MKQKDDAGPFATPQTIDKARSIRDTERAVLAVASWSDAVGIHWKPPTTKGGDLLILDSTGQEHSIYIIQQEQQQIPQHAIGVSGWDLLNQTPEIAYAAFWKITEPLGYGRPIPVDRGSQPAQKLCYKDDMELVAMRHWPLRLSPDLSKEKMAPFLPIIQNCSKYFYFKNQRYMDLWGYKSSDLESYATTWLLVFYHNYRKLFAPLNENKALFTRYIQQKFLDLYKLMQQKSRNIFPEGETLVVAIYEESLAVPPNRYMLNEDESPIAMSQYTANHPYDNDPDSSEDTAYQKRNNKLNKGSAGKRRKSATALLDELLGKLPHDGQVAVLTEALENQSFDHETRMAAKKKLRKHTSVCGICPVK